MSSTGQAKPRPKPSLRTELLFNLAFLAGAALLLGGGTILLVSALAPGMTPDQLFPVILVLVGLDVTVFIVFGSYLVRRLILHPLGRLTSVADAVAAGDLDARAPEAETRDFDTLGARLNRMTDHLLDARGYLVRAEKLASVGRLAAGIAHEVRNPLGAIGTYAQVLKRRGDGDPAVIDGMQREIERIDWIIRGLLDYASPSDATLEPVDPGAVARGAFGLLQAQGAFKGPRVRLDVALDLPTILGRSPALEQALVNLMLNALDAAPEGEVALTVRPWSYEPGHAPPRRTSDPAWVVFPRPPRRGPQRPEYEAGLPGVLLVVADSGPGVAPEDRHRVFEPFYTTKPPGRGTGLGLAIVQRMADDMGGVVWVEQAREGGAAFKLFFPVHKGVDA